MAADVGNGRSVNPTAAALLGFLHEGPMTGWDLVQLAQQRIGGFWTLTQSQVYRELSAMATQGLVEAGARGSRDRRPFTITTAGREAFATWIRRIPGEENLRVPLLLAVNFAGHMPPGHLHDIVRHHRDIHVARLAAYRERERLIREHEPDGDPLRLATLTFGIAYEAAAVVWFDALPPGFRGDGPWPPADDAAAGDGEDGR